MSAYLAEGTPAMIELESMIDKTGVRNVIYAVAAICFAKAEHVRASYNDRTTAGVWNMRGNLTNAFANKLAKQETRSGVIES